MTHPSPPKYADDQNTKIRRRLQRAQWLRAAILGASDGLLSTTSLMLGIGAAEEDKRSIILSGLAGALAGACSMAVGEFVSVSTQRDIQMASSAPPPHHNSLPIAQQTTPPSHKIIMSPLPGPGPGPGPGGIQILQQETEEDGDELLFTSPYQAAAASAFSFLCGSTVPLLSAIFLTAQTLTRILVIMVITSLASALFGGLGAYLGGSRAVRISAIRVLIGGWIAMAITYALLKPFDTDD